MKNAKKGAILVLSGPSGAGKSTIINAASDEIGEYYFSISTTTRAPRMGEEDGKDYFVHISGIVDGQSLNEGDHVTFEVVDGERGPKAENVKRVE